MIVILGIETSCDETAAAVVVDGRDVRSNVILSQAELHRKYAGVVPEIASRAHLEMLDEIVRQALDQAGMELFDLDAVAVSGRPGLVGCLLIGLTCAKTLAWVAGKPLFVVNHVHAHATSPAISLDHEPWPAVALVVSGGHTSLYFVVDPGRLELMGGTADDASGEAFDKVAAILHLGYPGGPAIDEVAASGDPRAVDFPRPLLGDESLDFSFSGIKTAVLYHVHGSGKTTGGLERLSRAQIADIAASFQAAVSDVLVHKTMLAARRAGVDTVLAGGGVIANSLLRKELQRACADSGCTLHLAALAYCTDNAAMIAAHAYHLFRRGLRSGFKADACANEPNELIYRS